MNTKKKGLHRLEDIEVEEVSVVDRAANKRRFLLVKRSGQMGKQVVSKDGKLTTEGSESVFVLKAEWKDSILQKSSDALERFAQLVERIKGADAPEGDGELSFPEDIVSELKAIAEAIVGIPEEFLKTAKADDGSGDDREDVEKGSHWMRTLKEVIDLLNQRKSAPSGAPNTQGPNMGAGVQPDTTAATRASQAFAGVPGLSDLMKSLTEFVDSSSHQVEDLRNTVAKQAKEISDLKKGIGPQASAEDVSNERVKKNDGKVAWPLDLNNPRDGGEED